MLRNTMLWKKITEVYCLWWKEYFFDPTTATTFLAVDDLAAHK